MKLSNKSLALLCAGLVATAGCEGESEMQVPLEDTYWRLVRVDGQNVDDGIAFEEPHLVFDGSENVVGGSGGCNLVSARYTTDGDRLELDDIVSTLRLCQEGMEIENVFLEALQIAARWEIDGDELEISDVMGEFLMRFEADEPSRL